MQTPIRQIGPYQILEEIGRGGMAVVYRAVDARSGDTVALKVLPLHLAHDENYLQRFLREGRNAARLQHPNIVRVLETGAADGHYFMALQFVDGMTLATYLRQRTMLPVAEAIALLRQVAGALDFAHALGFLHRDVKPSNILLDQQGNALLADFGVAKVLDDDVTAYTVIGTAIGTPAFMAPEQARGDAVDSRADVYSLGVVAYSMLTGIMPFKADSQHALTYQVIYEQPIAPETANPSLPSGILYALRRVLAKTPATRYASAGAFVDALETGLTWIPSTGEWRALDTGPLRRLEEDHTLPLPPAPKKRKGIRWPVWVLVAAAILGAGYLLLVQPPWLTPWLTLLVPATATPAGAGAATLALVRFHDDGGGYELEVPATWKRTETQGEDATLTTFDAPDQIARFFVQGVTLQPNQPPPPLAQQIEDFAIDPDMPYVGIALSASGAPTQLASMPALTQTLHATWLGRPVVIQLTAIDAGTQQYLVGSVIESSRSDGFAPVATAVIASFRAREAAPTATATATASPAATLTPAGADTATASPATATATPSVPPTPATMDTATAPSATATATASPATTPTPSVPPTPATTDTATAPPATATPTSTPTSTPTPAPTPTATTTASPTATATKQATATPLPTPTPTANAPATEAALVAQMATAVAATLTALPTPTPTSTLTPTPTPTSTLTPTPTPTATLAPTSTPRPTATPLPTSTPRPSPTQTATSTATAPASPTAIPSVTPRPPAGDVTPTPDLMLTLTAIADEITRLAPTPTPDLEATLTAIAAEITRLAPTPTPDLNATMAALSAEMTRLATTLTPAPRP